MERGGRPIHTIQQLVNKHKVVLDGLLIELPKIPSPQPNQPIQEFKHQRSIGIALGDSDQVDVLMLDMAEGRGAESEDGGADLGVGDDLNAEDVGEAGAAVVAEGAEDEVFAFLVED